MTNNIAEVNARNRAEALFALEQLSDYIKTCYPEGHTGEVRDRVNIACEEYDRMNMACAI